MFANITKSAMTSFRFVLFRYETISSAHFTQSVTDEAASAFLSAFGHIREIKLHK